MKLADLLSDMIASGADMDAINAVVQAAKHQEDAKEQRRREQTAERVRIHRERKRNASNALQELQALQGGGKGREDARADEDNLPLDLQEKETPKGVSKKKVLRKPETRIAVDTQPEAADREVAERSGMDAATFRHQWSRFRDWHIANDQGRRDWRGAWRNWVSGWVEKGCHLIGGGQAKALKVAGDSADPRIEFGGGISAPLSRVRQHVEQDRWRSEWGPRPDEPGCRVPHEFRSQILPKKPQAEQPQQLGLLH